LARRKDEEIQADVSTTNQLIADLQKQSQDARSTWEKEIAANPQRQEGYGGIFIDPNKDKLAELKNRLKNLDYERQGLGADGAPVRPDYESWLDPETGMMRKQYQMNPELLDPTKLEGFQALKKRVLTEGPSAWANMMIEKQKLEEAQQKDAAARQVQSSAAQARQQLAMRGGMASGARERLAMGGARDLMLQRQGIASQGQQARMGVMTEDEAQRLKLLPGFAEGEAKFAEYNTGLKNKASEWNIVRALEEKRAKDAQDLAVYQEQIKKWASEREAEATRNSGGGGGK
jgi:hypothetical protein